MVDVGALFACAFDDKLERDMHHRYIEIFCLRREIPLKRLVTSGPLNAPWGMIIYNGALLVSNFGNGLLTLFDMCTGNLITVFKDCCGNALALTFARGLACTPERIFFGSAINAGSDGLLGEVTIEC